MPERDTLTADARNREADLLFVSYTPADEGWASWIAWELESAGYRVLLQAWDFVPGTNFIDFMDRGVASAAAVIAVLSRSYLASRFGRWEWQSAILGNPDDPAAKLITVRVEDCSLEGLLSTITYVDLVGVRDEQQAAGLLLTRVRHALAGRAKPGTRPPFPSGTAAAAAVTALPGTPGTPGPPSEGTGTGAVARAWQSAQLRRRPAARPRYPPGGQQAGSVRDGVSVLHVPGPRFGREPAAGLPATATDFQARVWADVHRLVEAGAPPPNLLVVSGDLTESGALREFDDAVTFLTGLRALLGLEPGRCVIVPGTRDITRLACQAYFADCQADSVDPRPPYWPKWRHYSRVFAEFYRDVAGVTFDVAQPWTLFPVPGVPVVIAGLNSTMAESHRPEDRYGWVGEAQATWFAERLRGYAADGWLRIGVVAHAPAQLRDAAIVRQLLGGHLNLLLHGSSQSQAGTRAEAPGPAREGTWPAAHGTPLTLPAGQPGEHAIVQLTADGAATWRLGPDMTVTAPEHAPRTWHAAAATFPAPAALTGDTAAAAGMSAPAGTTAGTAGPGGDAGAPGRNGGDDVSGRSAPPAARLLDAVAEVAEAAHPGAKIRRVLDDNPPHLIVTHTDGGFVQRRRIAAHVGEVTREVVDAFAAQLHTGEPSSGAELVCTGHRPPAVLRAEALRRGIRVSTFTEFQGLLDLRDYVDRQSERLLADGRYPHSLYVPQLYRDLEASVPAVRENLVEDVLAELSADQGRFILVLGDFGRGKTFALRELARHIPARLPHLVPVYVELRELDKAYSVDSLVAAHLAKHGEGVIDLNAFRYMLARGRIVLLFDGFDELATRVTYDRAADHLQTLLAAAEGKAKIVVASRTQHFKSPTQVFTALGERVGQLPTRRVLGIEDFTADQIRAYLRNFCGEEKAAAERFDLMSGIEDLLGLASNPRMLSFIASLDAGRLRAVADAGRALSAAELYRAILDGWLRYEYDRVHGVPGSPLGPSEEDLWRAVTVLAMRMSESMEPAIALGQLAEEAAASLAGLAGGQLTAEQAAHAIGAGSLLIRGDDGRFGFIHSSVAEWLVASEVARQVGPRADTVPRAPVTAPGALERRALTQLSVDFLCDLADPLALQAWAEGALADPGATDAARSNALRVTARLRVPARADLRGATLRGEDLSHRELAEVDFTGADLSQARLVGTTLAGAVLRGTRLAGARLDGADLRGADLRGADLRGARLFRADLAGARLDGSRWDRAALIDVAGLPEETRRRHAAELRGAAISPGHPVLTETAPADVGVPYGYHHTIARLPQPIAYSADGGLLAVGDSDGGVLLCDAGTGLPVRALRGHRGRVYGVGHAGGGRLLVTAAADATIRLWDTATGTCTRVIEVAEPGAWPVEASPDGRLLAYGAPDGVVRLLDLAAGPAGRVTAELPGHEPPVYTAAFGRSVLMTGDRAGVIRVWDLATGRLRTQLTSRGGAVFRLLASRDGTTGGGATMFAAGGANGMLLLLDADGFRIADLVGHSGAIYALDTHPARPLLASGDTDGSVRLWDLAARTQRAVLTPHPGAVYGLSFSPDGQHLASACSDGLVRVTGVADGRIRHELTAHKSAVWRPVYQPGGGQLATASNDGSCRLWDTATGQQRSTLRGHGRRVTSATFSADGTLLAAGGNDGVVRVWDPVTGRRLHALAGSADRLVSAVFGPSGALLAAASNDGGVYLWNAAAGIAEREMDVDTSRVWAEAFTPDGRYKSDGPVSGEFWHVIGNCRFEPGELDPYLPSVTRLPLDAPLR